MAIKNQGKMITLKETPKFWKTQAISDGELHLIFTVPVSSK